MPFGRTKRRMPLNIRWFTSQAEFDRELPAWPHFRTRDEEQLLALGVLTLTTAVGAAIIPAVIASNREPIRELRVP